MWIMNNYLEFYCDLLEMSGIVKLYEIYYPHILLEMQLNAE